MVPVEADPPWGPDDAAEDNQLGWCPSNDRHSHSMVAGGFELMS
jgi:hypothetical protein